MRSYKRIKVGKSFYRTFFSIYIVLVLQNIVTLSVNLADNIMLGAYSEASLSGVAAVNQIQFVYQQVLTAFGDGLVIFCSQYWGMKRTEPMKRIAAAAMYAGLLVCALLFGAATFFPEQMLRLFTTDAEIVAEGVRYLNIIRFTYVFFAVTQILLATLRSVQIVRIAFLLSVQTFFINCGINYVLIYGRFGAPEMGVAGAAVGTLAARAVESVVLILFIARKEKNLRLRLADYLKFDVTLCRDYLKLTSPMVVVQGLWGLNTAMQTVILGHMTSAAIAANSAASTLFMLVKSLPVGAASTASVLIGKTIGAGDLDLVKNYARVLQKMFVLIGAAGGIALFFLRIPVLGLYDLSDATKQMADTFLVILKRGICRDGLPDADEQRHHPGRRGRDVRRQDGYHQHLDDRDPAVTVYGVCREGIPGGRGLLPQRRPDLQVRAGVYQVKLRELDPEADEGVTGAFRKAGQSFRRTGRRRAAAKEGRGMNYTYILRCADGSYYTGWTNDLERRVRAHSEGRGCKYTRSRTPVELVYFEEFETRSEAMSREAGIKRLTRAQKEAMIRQNGMHKKGVGI